MATRRALLSAALRVGGGILLASCAPTVSAPGASAPAASAPAAASKPTAGTPKRGGTLTFGVLGRVNSFEPAKTIYYEERQAGNLVYDPLIALDDNGEPNAARSLAESWEAPDPLTFIMHLRKGVKFIDGTPFDAEAAKWNVTRHLDPATGSTQRTNLKMIASVEATDSSTLRFRLNTPFVGFSKLWSDQPGYQLSPTAYAKDGKDKYPQNPVGTGPFKLVELVANDHATFERNPNYWGSPLPYLDSVIIKSIPNGSTRLVALQTGGADLAQDLPYQDIARIRQMPEIVLHQQPYRQEHLRFNTKSPLAKSKEFRQAWNWALDREAVKQTVYFGTGEVGYGPIFPGTPFHDASYKPFTRDVGKAKALLDKAAGLPSPLRFTYYVSEDPVRQREGEVFQANFRDIGVTMDIQKEPDAAWNARFNKGDYELGASWKGNRPDPHLYMPIFGSDGANYVYYQPGQVQDPVLDKAIADAAVETSLDKRKALYRQATERINDEAGFVFYRFGPIYVGSTSKVRGFTDPAQTIFDFSKVWIE